MNEKLSDPKKTIEVIQKYQFAFQKRFGQNFLIDAHVLEKIVSAAGITRMTAFWKLVRELVP